MQVLGHRAHNRRPTTCRRRQTFARECCDPASRQAICDMNPTGAFQRRLETQMVERMGRHRIAQVLALMVVVIAAMMTIPGRAADTDEEWRFYGGDQGARQYSSLSQINRDNVKNLRVRVAAVGHSAGDAPRPRCAGAVFLHPHAADGRWVAVHEHRLRHGGGARRGHRQARMVRFAGHRPATESDRASRRRRPRQRHADPQRRVLD